MKEKQQHEVILNGVPKLENMPKDTLMIFCRALLKFVEEGCKEGKPRKELIFP